MDDKRRMCYIGEPRLAMFEDGTTYTLRYGSCGYGTSAPADSGEVGVLFWPDDMGGQCMVAPDDAFIAEI
jgi:hypothetical protein